MFSFFKHHVSLLLSATLCAVPTVPTSVIENTVTSTTYTGEATHTLVGSVSPTPPGSCVSDASGLSFEDAVAVSVVTLAVTFAVTFVLAFTLGVLVHAVVVKQCRGRSKSASGATPSGPVYEVVDSREENTRAQQKFELKENVAYGPVGM